MELWSNAVASRPSPSEHVCPVPPGIGLMGRAARPGELHETWEHRFLHVFSVRRRGLHKHQLGRLVAGEYGRSEHELAMPHLAGENGGELLEAELGTPGVID